MKVDRQNRLTYSSTASVAAYAGDRWLPVEVMIFAHFFHAHVGARILDLACGSGRLASVLGTVGNSYVGVDYSPEMVATFRQRHPHLKAVEADIRTFRRDVPQEFDIVWLSFNSIDSIPFDDRLQVYAGVRNSLCIGGYFVFSTHNLGYVPSVDRRKRLATCCLICRGKSLVRQTINRRHLSRFESIDRDFAVVNDRALDFGLLNVYVNPDHEVASLQSSGFSLLEIRAADGRVLDLSATLMNVRAPWFYFVMRRSE